MKTETPLKELFNTTVGIHLDRWEEFKKEVIEACRVTEVSWNNWMRGSNGIERKNRDIIDQIAVVKFGKMPYTEREETIHPEEATNDVLY